MAVDYSKNIIIAAKLLKNNLKLFLPDLIFLILGFILAFLFFHLNGLLELFASFYNKSAADNLIKNIISNTPSLVKLITSFFVTLILGALLGLGLICMRYALIRAAISKEKLNLKAAYKEAKTYFFTLFKIHIILTLLVVVPIVILGAIIALIKIKSYAVLAILFPTLLILTYVALIKIAFLFVYPILTLKTKNGAYKTLKETYGYFLKNKKKAFITFLILIAGGFGFALLNSGLISVINSSLKAGNLYLVFVLLIYGLRSTINIAIKLWGEILIFTNY